MSQFSPPDKCRFVVATPGHSVCEDNARALQNHGHLRLLALGTRRGGQGVPAGKTSLNPRIGALVYLTAKYMSPSKAEAFRFRLHPWFDNWVRRQLQPGDHIISSYGYANASFREARRAGGRTFLDGGNSHPENFWNILQEEHRRWNCPSPPINQGHYERSLAMLEHVDYVLCPSSFVAGSFLARGFQAGQILKNVYPVDLSRFAPASRPREPHRPLTMISTGVLSLRKGTPYMLEAFRIIHRKHPSARFRLTRIVQDNVRPILEKYDDLPIDWAQHLSHDRLVERLQGSDIFVLPSLEEGLVRTALEAMACGLPVILTPNTGTADFVKPGVNGEIVPIRDPQAIADAILKWADIIMKRDGPPLRMIDPTLISYEHFEADFIRQLGQLNLTAPG